MVWFASLAANPGLVCYPGGQPGVLHGGASLGFQDGAGTLGTGTEELLSPEPLELLPWEPGGEPWKPSCDMPAGTLDTDPPGGFREALNGGLGASIKRTPGLVENGSFQGI